MKSNSPESESILHRSHLKRLERVYPRQPIYFVTTCTAGRRHRLASPVAHAILREVWKTGEGLHGWSVGRYVVMPDHVHFFCRPGLAPKSDLSRFVGAWKEWTTKRLVRDAGWISPLWQPEFFDHLIRSDESLDEKWEYVCRNPERAGLVEPGEEWPYLGMISNWVRVLTR